MRDPYDVLGVSRGATNADIKKAFRKLAKKFHPDQSKEPNAKERFAEIGNAYEILGEPKKREQFDRGEIGADGKPKFQGFEGFGAGGAPRPGQGGFRWSGSAPFGGAGGDGGFSPDDILSEILGRGGFGGQARRAGRQSAPRGTDVNGAAAVTLEQLVRGDKARVQLPGGKTLEFSIPPGTKSGQTIRLRGQGEAGFGGTPGDALITIDFVPHPLFRVEGDNLRVDLPVTLDEAVLGGKVKAPTLEGPVTLTVPAAADAGKSLRLKGKGLPNAAGGRGDLFVTLRIVLPDPMDPELEALVRRWRQEGRTDVRGRAYES